LNSLAEVIALEEVPCCLGCPEGDDFILTGRDILHDLPGEFNVLKCRCCGLMRTSPRPSLDSIGIYYPDNYGPYAGTKVNLLSKSLAKKLIKPVVKFLFRFNTNNIPKIKPGRMLEVGCASGSFLNQMFHAGWQVQGIEFSEKAAQSATALGHQVHVGSLETAPAPDHSFDLIVGWMVLEHLHDPVLGLKKLHAWADPGAWLVLSVPNAGSYEFGLFKQHWYALQLPTHNHHFSPQTMAKILAAGGWSLERVYHQRTLSNFIASLGYKLRKRGYRWLGGKLIRYPEYGGYLPYIVYPIAYILSLFGQTGRMTVWARRKSC
jgi:2-polyprenyl-3-methyl-5-hydroxy-6-metoxy-1,4-benzoquinol methylase